MSESDYTSLEEIERDHSGIRYKDVVVCEKKFNLRSLNALQCMAVVNGNTQTANQRAIVAVVEKPKMTRESIKRLSKIDGAFIAALAKECYAHAGIDSLDDVEEETKN